MKLISWNVNGIRSVLKKGALDLVAHEKPDIICFQETKAHPDDVEAFWPEYDAHWNWAQRKGYSGVLTLSKREPLSVSRGIGKAEHDNEGRVLTTEFAAGNASQYAAPDQQARIPNRNTRVRCPASTTCASPQSTCASTAGR